jgi:hypothetical protein
VEAATASALAGSISAVVSAVSATIGAISARNSWRSARASEAALQETRRQRRAEDIRREIAALGTLHDESAALVRALATDLRADPAAVERSRSALRRSIMTSGIVTPGLAQLLGAQQPLAEADRDAIDRQLLQSLDDLRRELEERA